MKFIFNKTDAREKPQSKIIENQWQEEKEITKGFTGPTFTRVK